MERNANYALVGFISTAIIIGLLAFIVWLAGANLTRDYDLYDIVFKGPVRGLTQGGEVHFNGIKVGEVTKLSLDPHNPQLVVARARVTSDVPIRSDSYATLEPQGITGVNYVQITAGTATRPLLQGHRARRDGAEDEQQDATRCPICWPAAATSCSAPWRRSTASIALLSDDNIKTLSAAMSDLQAVTGELRERKSIIADAQHTLQSADQAMQQIRDLAKSSNGLVNGEAKQTLAKLDATAAEAQATLKDLRGLTDRLAGPTAQFASQGLPELTQTISGLQRTTENLDRLLSEVQTNPSGLVGKAKGQDRELKP